MDKKNRPDELGNSNCMRPNNISFTVTMEVSSLANQTLSDCFNMSKDNKKIIRKLLVGLEQLTSFPISFKQRRIRPHLTRIRV